MTELILVIMVIYVTMVYGPIAAFVVEMFPTKVRYTSMSLPYHIGNGWFGGMLPLLATAVVAATGNIYNGLWYPIGDDSGDRSRVPARYQGCRYQYGIGRCNPKGLIAQRPGDKPTAAGHSSPKRPALRGVFLCT
jgi:hypothetical protein